MKAKLLLLAGFIIFAINSNAANRVRRVPVVGDQIVTVRTSIGIATILQVPDRPNSVVVGDQDSFKVEYLDQAITIKPLSGIAKSNLYIYTDWKRFNVELVSGSEDAADYVVYLENPKEKVPTSINNGKSEIKWTNFKNTLRNEMIHLEVNRLGRTKDGILLIEFFVSSKSKVLFKPEWIWLTQSSEIIPIHNLFLSSLELNANRNISGVLQVREKDLSSAIPIKLEIRRQRISYLSIRKVASWKP